MEDRVESNLVGSRLRRWRDDRNLSGPEVAARVEARLGEAFGWPDLRPLELGEVFPNARQTEALAAAFGVSVNDLLGPETADEVAARVAALEPPPVPDDRPANLKQRSPHRPGRRPRAGDDGDWHLRPGDQIKRTELHDLYGGGRQGGIAPCRESANVLIFSDPNVGNEHGYFDRWESDDIFLYCGEGQRGDQEMTRGNRAILNHRTDRRALRVFEGCSGIVRYAGEFEVAHGRPYLRETAQSTGGGPTRQVIMFRLDPID